MPEPPITLAEVAAVFAAVDGGEGVPLTEEVLDLSFYDLGHDSLTVLQALAVLGDRYGVHVGKELVVDAETPRLLLDILQRLADWSRSA
ncbi:acyl carrier protein [Kitasatospora sp. NPDC048365]|uniref:acyl carrier protein n=1 Tax=Kitasatospora sp. NPDC048365 TaxID=3364050 RepID=UPI003719F94A